MTPIEIFIYKLSFASLEMLTENDKEYLKALYLLNAHHTPVGPSTLAHITNITKEAAYQQLRRLQNLGYGDYQPRKGLLLNTTALSTIKDDIHRHHLIEHFLQHSLKLSAQEACQHSYHLQAHICQPLLEAIKKNIGTTTCSTCGEHLFPTQPDHLNTCHYLTQKQRGKKA